MIPFRLYSRIFDTIRICNRYRRCTIGLSGIGIWAVHFVTPSAVVRPSWQSVQRYVRFWLGCCSFSCLQPHISFCMKAWTGHFWMGSSYDVEIGEFIWHLRGIDFQKWTTFSSKGLHLLNLLPFKGVTVRFHLLAIYWSLSRNFHWSGWTTVANVRRISRMRLCTVLLNMTLYGITDWSA